jgi:hypothetical protein
VRLTVESTVSHDNQFLSVWQSTDRFLTDKFEI